MSTALLIDKTMIKHTYKENVFSKNKPYRMSRHSKTWSKCNVGAINNNKF